MIVKVCGITQQKQNNWLTTSGIDMIGFNFYPQSKRFLSHVFKAETELADRVGVFVNHPIDDLFNLICEHKLSIVQLHGNESSNYCAQVAKRIPVIKAFGVDDEFNFEVVKPYLPFAKYFLFDTKTIYYGGSGIKFNWQKLAEYNYHVPFLVSGGITLQDIPDLMKLRHKSFLGIDVNSGFEVSPGIKDLKKIEQMMKLLDQ